MTVDEIRFAIFLGVFILMLLLESMIPLHPTVDSKPRRLGINLSLTCLDILIIKIVFQGMVAVGVARFAQEQGWGLLNYLDLPAGVEVIITVIFLDLMIYLQHVLVHMVPFFWRFHAVHHSDRDLDVSSGLRFHPIEIVGSMLYKMGIVLALGPSPFAVMAFEAILNGMAQFSHSNIKLPLPMDRSLRWLLVTPDMHRIHHSVEVEETNSNYGFNLSVWDRLLGTYVHNGKKTQPEIVIGLKAFPKNEDVSFTKLLLMPTRYVPNSLSAR